MTQLYKAFEDKFRGSRELILDRLQVYRPLVEALARNHPNPKAIDLGCGRGEMLELLKSTPFQSIGIDLDGEMLDDARKRGFEVIQSDAIEYLEGIDENSIELITAFHVVEHLEFEQLRSLIKNAYRVLRPHGVIILETPNPESLQVSSWGFYMDPTHKAPLPPELLKFLVDFHDFEPASIWRLQEAKEQREDYPSLCRVVQGVSPDYAVVAQKPLEAFAEHKNAPDGIKSLLSAPRGISLTQATQKYDKQMADTFQKHVAEAFQQRADLGDLREIVEQTRQDVAGMKQDLLGLRDFIQRRPRPLWEKIIFRRSGKPKKMFRRILFHTSGKPRGIFRNWVLLPDGRPRAVFYMWMSSPEYQNMRGAVRFSAVTHNAQVPLSPDAQQVARRIAALRPPSSRM